MLVEFKQMLENFPGRFVIFSLIYFSNHHQYVQVAILFGSESLKYMTEGCGGALVGEKYVITAAHCVDDKYPENLFVRVGDTSLDTSFEATAFTVGVVRIKQHPDFDPETYENDIAVLELLDSISLYDYPNIKPACLPTASSMFPDTATVSGWGTFNDWVANAWLNEATVKVFEKDNCGSMNSLMTEDMLCAGFKKGGRDACRGDDGGPLIASDIAKHNAQTLIGIYSFSSGCGLEDYPGVYANVTHFTSWLNQQMPDLNTCDPYDEPWLFTTTTSTTTTTTIAGSCGNCVFPFIYVNRIYHTCETSDADTDSWPVYWCHTDELDSLDYPIIEECEESSCPGTSVSTTEQMSVHPANAPGNCCE